jgi:hypothetical protein
MIATYFGIGKSETCVPFAMYWLQRGMFPIEAYAYVATSVYIFRSAHLPFTEIHI